MTPYRSSAEDLVLHGVRVLGFAPAGRIAGRFRLDRAETEELLLDHEARGWVTRSNFGGSLGWSLTEAGRDEGERRLAAELEASRARGTVMLAHEAFASLNTRFCEACTAWQIRPEVSDPLAVNDHDDPEWDGRVLARLADLGRALGGVTGPLTSALERFGGYDERYRLALEHAEAGRTGWVDGPDRDSMHTVWVQLHEDLLATLGMSRGT